MRKPTVYVCEVCSTEKGTANHWFVIVPVPESANVETAHFKIFPWTKERDYADSLHLCGQECLGKQVAALSENLVAPQPGASRFEHKATGD